MNISARLWLPAIRCQCFIRIFLRFGVAGLKVVTKGIIFLDVLGLLCKAVLRIENFISVRISSAKLLGKPRSKSRVKNCNFLNSKDSLTEFVLSKRKASPFTKPFSTLRGWHEEKCVYWNVSVGLKCV